MEQLIKYAIGVDGAKDKFDVCLMSVDRALCSKVKACKKFSNSLAGFKEFLLWAQKHCKKPVPFQILMEATGVYHEKLAIWLTEQGKEVLVVLANKARRYMQSLGLKTKNDRADARGLAMMCLHHQFDVWKPIGKYNYELRLLTRHYQSTQELKTVLLNQLHALEHSGYTSKQVSKQLKKTIGFFEKQLQAIKTGIADHINGNEEAKRKVGHICKIKGVDILTVATIIAETNGFELFHNQSQLASYAGYDVVENQSGKHTGKTRISKKGNSRIRRILHMPALNVVRWQEPAFQRLQKRIYEKTKIKMKGYVAVQKKLLLVMYTLWKKDQPYRNDYEEKIISGNDGHKLLFPFEGQKNSAAKSGTTQDELRYNESHEVLFPLIQK